MLAKGKPLENLNDTSWNRP